MGRPPRIEPIAAPEWPPRQQRGRRRGDLTLWTLLLSALVLVLAWMPRPASADACASYQDCLSCSNASMTCHWCSKDNACHTIGSPYGCLTGVNCYSNQGQPPAGGFCGLVASAMYPPTPNPNLSYVTNPSNPQIPIPPTACVRNEPQPMPHKAPSGSVLIGLGVFLLSALLCTGACFFVANEYVHHNTAIRMEKDPNYQELVVRGLRDPHMCVCMCLNPLLGRPTCRRLNNSHHRTKRHRHTTPVDPRPWRRRRATKKATGTGC